MAFIIQGPGNSYVRGPGDYDPWPGSGGDPSLTQNIGEAGVFVDQPTAAAWMAGHNPLPGGAAPTYIAVNGDQDFSTDSTT